MENLQTLGQLCILGLGANRISKIEELQKLTQLQELYLSENHLKTIENLDSNKNLIVLDVSKNQNEYLDDLQSLGKFTELWLNNQIKRIGELSKLEQVTNLQYIIIRLLNMKKIIKLKFYYNLNNQMQQKYEELHL